MIIRKHLRAKKMSKLGFVSWKRHFTIFFNNQGYVAFCLLTAPPQGQFAQSRPGDQHPITTAQKLLLHGNASPRRTTAVTQCLEGQSFQVFHYPPYWEIQWIWFARVNALGNLSHKKSREVAAHFRADFWVGVASRCVEQWTLNLESRSSTNANTVAVAKFTVERG